MFKKVMERVKMLIRRVRNRNYSFVRSCSACFRKRCSCEVSILIFFSLLFFSFFNHLIYEFYNVEYLTSLQNYIIFNFSRYFTAIFNVLEMKKGDRFSGSQTFMHHVSFEKLITVASLRFYLLVSKLKEK